MSGLDSDLMAVKQTPIQKIISNFAKVFSGQIMVVILSFIAFAVNTRALGVAAFGVLVAIQAICMLVSKVAAFQTWQAMSRYGAEALERHDRMAFRRYMTLGMVLDVAAALIAGLLCLGYFYVMHAIGKGDPQYLLVSYFYTISVVTAATGAAIGILRVTDKFGINIAINVTRAALLLAAAILLDYYDQPLTMYLIVIPTIMAFGNICQLLAGFIRGLQVIGRLQVAEEDGFNRRGFLGFAMATSGASTLNAFRQRGELLLISFFLGDGAAGLYGAAYRSASILSRFAEAGRQSVFPEFAKLITGGKSREARRIASKSARTSILLAAPIFLGAILFGGWWLTLISGPEFAKGHINLIWLTMSTLAYTLTFGLGPYVQIGFGALKYLQIVCIAFVFFLIGAVAGPLWLGQPGAGMGAGLFGIMMVVLLYRQIYAASPETLDQQHFGETVSPVKGAMND